MVKKKPIQAQINQKEMEPPPPPSGSIGKISKTNEKKEEGEGGSVLYLAGHQLDDVHNWISKKRKIVLFTTQQLKEKLMKEDFGGFKRYSHIETFENYGHNGLVEFQAMKLSEKYNFKHVFFLTLFFLFSSLIFGFGKKTGDLHFRK